MSAQIPLKHDEAEQLSSPDELDRLLVVVTLRGWIPLLTLLSLCVAAIVWGIFGRIPVTVSGHGILISPGNVKGLQAQSGGQVAELELRVGQRVEKGQRLGTLSQSSLRTEIEQTSRKLLEVRQTHDDAVKLEDSRRSLEQASVAEQSALITEEIRKLQLHISGLRSKNEVFNRSQRENLMRTRQLSEKSRDSLTKFLEGLQTLKKEGLASGQTLLDAERQLDESQLRLADLDVKLSEIDVREIESSENLTVQENRIADLTLQLKKIEIEDKRSQQELLEKRAVRETELNDQQRILDRLNGDLEQRSQLLSPYTGRVLDLIVSPGQLISAGDRIGTIEIEDPDFELKNLAYFEVRDGKRIREGMPAFITPSTVQREREGSIVGRVSRCSRFPVSRQGAINAVGSQEVADELTSEGGMIEVEAELVRDPEAYSGYRWTSRGPELKFSAGTTTSVRVTVEQRAPITYVLPILRSWLTGASDEVPEAAE